MYTTSGDIVMVHYAIDVDSVQGTAGEAVLMRKDGSSGEYGQIDAAGASIEYAGDWTGTWTVPNENETSPLIAKLPFAEGHRGSIERLKVRFNYTNPNGEDYVDSDEIILCRGTYIGSGETFLGGSGFSVSFPLDTYLVDPDKVTGVSATIMVDGTGIPLPEDSISISDGTARVGCLMEYLAEQGVSLAHDGSSYPVWITLLYEDGDISWEDSATGYVNTPNLGSYITGGYVSPLSGSEITPAGFRATFFLDAEVIGHPKTEQPYEGGKTLDVTSVWLVRDNVGTEIEVDDLVFDPAESPSLSFTYNAPSDEQLTPGDYNVGVELSYNDPTAEPPVVDLLDSRSKEFTVVGSTSTYTPPAFSSAYAEDVEDNFIEVYFTIDLQDAAAQTGTATLMRKNSSTGEYEPVEDDEESPSLPYGGDQTESWSVPNYDAENDEYHEMRAELRLPSDKLGSVEQLCVRFEYTLPDGSTGTIESDPFTFFLGTYVSFENAHGNDETVSASFQIDDRLVFPGDVNVESMVIELEDRNADVTAYTSIVEDGAVWLICAPGDFLQAGESLIAGESYYVDLELACDIDGQTWYGDAFGLFVYEGLSGAPGITIDHVYVWSGLLENSGLRRAEIVYTVDPGDADEDSIVTTATLTDGTNSMTLPSKSGSGSFSVNVELADDFKYTSGCGAEVELECTLNGESYSKKETKSGTEQFVCGLSVNNESNEFSDELVMLSGTLTFSPPTDDPRYSYSASMTGARVIWYPTADPEPTGEPIEEYSLYFEDESLSDGTTYYAVSLSAPASAESFRLIFEADAQGEAGSDIYPYVGGLTAGFDGEIQTGSLDGIFLDGSFDYDADKNELDGSVLLADDVDPGAVSNIVLYFYTLDGDEWIPSGSITPGTSNISLTDNTIDFTFGSSDSIPSISTGWYVVVSGDYEGYNYNSQFLEIYM